ncbi:MULTISPECIES: hypothetical protein [unclassified Bradyrhizobium]|uniref:hypothetical protein n=1 Tax=unclassified Bradyrhizobium TaxID=2631580 RepID=UPI00247B2B78|nr:MULTISPECIES: hypothetical protein [unclassified Bradyrhizobium]WGS23881.1 hypothetical protein MTX22_17880 [Bradyrhizobium sp. ISRA463]WGS31196.1 hypothetical protein MTX19_15605 [Bradyrhizobium sp. ISRA464]
MLVMVPTSTLAQERGGDAALGAISGALVFGPVGAIAGAVVGYTAGPSISRSMVASGRHTRRSTRRATQVVRADRHRVVPAADAPQAAAPEQRPVHAMVAAPTTETAPPPVQGFE